jgi:hypothetical protein
MDRCPTVGVVRVSGQVLDRIHKDIVQFSQRLLGVLGNQRRWDTLAIERELDQMVTMITRYHSCFQGIWFSGFVRMWQGGPVEMITTCNVHVVSDREHDVKCLKEPLMLNLCRCLSQASMNALIHVVDHASKSYKADCLGWKDLISGARNLLTRTTSRGLQPCVMMIMML